MRTWQRRLSVCVYRYVAMNVLPGGVNITRVLSLLHTVTLLVECVYKQRDKTVHALFPQDEAEGVN